MAISRVTTWSSGQVLTAAALNGEFNNILNNPIALWSPAASAINFNGQTLTWDAAAVTTVVSSGSQAWQFTPGAKTGTPSATGAIQNWVASTYTDNNTAASGTAALFAAHALQRPTLAATNTGVVTTDAATLYIANSPAAGTNETLTNAWALLVAAGNVKLPGTANNLGTIGTGTWNGTAIADSYLAITAQGLLENVGISATVSSNNLTIALKGANGSDPSATNVVRLGFRSTPLTTGTTVMRNVTNATSLVINSGTTLGTVNGIPVRLYIVALDNAGTVELALWNPVSGTTLLGLNESNLYSSSTPGNSAQTLYSTTARSSVAVRILGYLEISEATAGTWATAPTVIQVMGPGVKRTGDLVQSIYASTAAQTSSISSSWASIGITQAIALTSALNPVRIMGAVNGVQKDAANANNAVGIRLVWNTINVYALFQNQAAFTGAAVINNVSVPFGGLHFTGVASVTYDVQFNSFNNTGTVYVQTASSTSYLLLEEVFQ